MEKREVLKSAIIDELECNFKYNFIVKDFVSAIEKKTNFIFRDTDNETAIVLNVKNKGIVNKEMVDEVLLSYGIDSKTIDKFDFESLYYFVLHNFIVSLNTMIKEKYNFDFKLYTFGRSNGWWGFTFSDIENSLSININENKVNEFVDKIWNRNIEIIFQSIGDDDNIISEIATNLLTDYYDKNNSLFDFFNIDTNFIDMLNEIEKVINETSKRWYYDVENWADLINFMIKGCYIDKK